jgi:hypothetical protein
MLAIAESDIEQLAQEEAQYKRPEDQDTTSMLEARIAQLEQRVTELERLSSVGTPAQPAVSPLITSRPRRASATTATFEPLENLPGHSTPYYDFADKHGVNARTFRDHIKKGNKKGEKVPAIERPRPGRKDEKTYWLTPEQQQAAIAYWQANNTTYHECLLCPHTDEVYQRAGQDQEEMAATS